MAAICAGVLPSPRIDLGEALPHGAVVIDLGEPEVFERLAAQPVEQPRLGLGGRDRAVADAVEEGADLTGSHRRISLRFVDFAQVVNYNRDFRVGDRIGPPR